MGLPRILPADDAAAEFLAFVADDLTRESVRQAAIQLGWPLTGVRSGGLAEACEWLQGRPAPPVLLVDVSGCEDVLASMDALADVCEPHTRVLVVGAVNDIGLYRALIGLGVVDYLVKPLAGATLAEALRRSDGEERRGGPAARPCLTAAVLGARGGVGATSLAVSLAWGLANEHQRPTVLLDLDLQFGAAAMSLDVEPGRGLRELLLHPERLDSLLIGSAVSQVDDRLRLLGAEEALDDDLRLDGRGVEPLLGALTESGQGVVIDAPRRLDPMARTALSQAGVVILVTDLSLTGMRDTQRLLELLGRLRGEGEVLLIGNRIGGVAGEVPRAEFERGVGRKLDFAIPHDAKAATAAAEQGKAVLDAGRQSPAAAEIRRLLLRLTGEPAPKAEKAAFLKRLLGA